MKIGFAKGEALRTLTINPKHFTFKKIVQSLKIGLKEGKEDTTLREACRRLNAEKSLPIGYELDL